MYVFKPRRMLAAGLSPPREIPSILVRRPCQLAFPARLESSFRFRQIQHFVRFVLAIGRTGSRISYSARGRGGMAWQLAKAAQKQIEAAGDANAGPGEAAGSAVPANPS